MVTIKEKLNLVKACFGEYKLSASGNNASVTCPICVSSGKITKKKKLSIDLKSGIYHCWVCEAKGKNIGHLARKFSREQAAALKLIKTYGKEEDIKEVVQEKHLFLPKDFKLLYDQKRSKLYKRHYNYLLSRGFSVEKMAKFRVGVSNEIGFKDRVIFPSFDPDQNLNYYITRSIDPNINFSFRYKNADKKRKDVIFRHGDISFDETIVLVEGVFDLVNCPDNATCILGSWLNEDYNLFKNIVSNKTPVILCLDPDAVGKSMKIAKLLSSYCVNVRISQNKEKDFGDMSSKEVKYFLDTSKQYDNASRIGYLINEIHSGSLF